ncbi:MAG: xanthine dehydrogenase family protein molybdopterin-binding subunit [Bacteroidetes bacterium]|nr:xanthine dehydrogenase family protein molybdopterin-binding subunit [Bacteroidota bacterium]
MPKNVELYVGLNDNLEKITSFIPDNEPKPWDGKDNLKYIGNRVPRIDGHLKTTGKAKYSFDIQLAGMLYGRILRSPYPSAIVKKIDYSKAAKYPGVKAIVLMSDDLPMQVRYAGQEILGIAADTINHANEAVKLIEIEYEKLEFVVDVDKARRPFSHVVHDSSVQRVTTEGDTEEEDEDYVKQTGNIRGPIIETKPEDISENDIDSLLDKCDIVHRATYKTQVQTHCALETHGVVAHWLDNDKLKVWASTQGTFSVREELAEYFNLPESNIQVITEFMGGGFGAKFGSGVYGVMAARLARKTNLPVRLMLDRKEEHLCVGNRPNSVQNYSIGTNKDGTLKAVKLIAYGTAGVGTGAGAGGPARGMYRPEMVYTSESDIFINAGPGAAFRAPGHPQGTFGFEQAIDETAYRVGIDPLEFRLINTTFDEVRQYELKRGAKKIGWNKRAKKANSDAGPIKRGLGVANSLWYYWYGRGHIVTINISKDGSVQLLNGAQDIGGGITTILAMVVAEELCLKVEDINVKFGDTNLGQGPASGGSVTTASLTPAARKAAYAAKMKMFDIAAPLLNTEARNLSLSDGKIFITDEPNNSLTWNQVASKIEGSQITATGERIKDSRINGVRWWISGVQFADVSVDVETGDVKINKIVAVHDCGRPMDRLTLESQVHGGVIQGISYALYEDRILDRNTGIMVNPNLEQYKIAGSLDIPEIDCEIVDFNQSQNASGAVGIGEPATIPTSAAIANAIYNAIGVRVRELPMTPDRILNALYDRAGS